MYLNLYHAIENTANKNTGKLLFMYIQLTGITSDLPIVHWVYVVFMYFLGWYKTVNMYTMGYLTCHLYFLASTHQALFWENTSDLWDIPCY